MQVPQNMNTKYKLNRTRGLLDHASASDVGKKDEIKTMPQILRVVQLGHDKQRMI